MFGQLVPGNRCRHHERGTDGLRTEDHRRLLQPEIGSGTNARTQINR